MKLAIGYVPVRTTSKSGTCLDKHNGYTCTEPLDHRTKHLAAGVAGTDGARPDQAPVYAEWANAKGRGFAAMDPQRQRRFAKSGGVAAQALGKCHVFTVEEARAAGRKGGAIRGADRDGMAAIGRLGGLAVSANRRHMSEIGGKGGSSVSDGPNGKKYMSEMGKKGAAARRAKKAAQ